MAQKFETEVEYEVSFPLDTGKLNLKIKVPPSTLTLDEIKKLVLDLSQKLFELKRKTE